MSDKIPCTVYIDEAGDLGIGRGTRWFVLSAVIVDKCAEPNIRSTLSAVKQRLNVNEIHIRKIQDFYRRAYVVREIAEEVFVYVNIIVDTGKLHLTESDTAYNYICRMLLERVSWYMRDTNREGDIVLSARGVNRDNELIDYIKSKLLPYTNNQISQSVFKKITAKAASMWDMLQLADVCATTMFLAYEQNGWGFRTPCFSKVLSSHLYKHDGKIQNYGIKYFDKSMSISTSDIACEWACIKKERTPGATTT